MAKHEFFKAEFDKLATDGVIGDPSGSPAYAYIRVSSDEQGEEGRSGLPRQLEHVHERALAAHKRIAWDMVFADDYTGFDLERPELTRLRDEYRSPCRRATAIVMEHLDRLSRNADWHQGFLLDEMKKRGIEPLFWKAFTSRIERVVMGTIAQDAMELSLERMADGTRKKAESGRVTARRVNYGYKFVDEHGVEGERARKQTHYAIREDEAAVIRQIYTRVAAGDTMTGIARDLAAAHVPPPKNTRAWTGAAIQVFIKNPVYKGEFIAHRVTSVEVEVPTRDGLATRLVKRTVERPEDEWIRVPVPPIVDAVTWQAANDMLAKNRAMATRNASKHERYLLTGLLKCPDCGATFRGRSVKPDAGSRVTTRRKNYRCRHGELPRYLREAEHVCRQPTISARIIEPAVWSVVCQTVVTPDVLLAALADGSLKRQNAHVEQRIAHVDAEIQARQADDDRLYRAYLAGVFDEREYGEKRRALKAEEARLKSERERLIPRLVPITRLEAQKQAVLQLAGKLQSLNAHLDPPFDVKQRILKMTVSQILLNAREGWFRLDGAVRGNYAIGNSFASEIKRARFQAAPCP